MSDIHEYTEHKHVEGNGEWRQHNWLFDDTGAHQQPEPTPPHLPNPIRQAITHLAYVP
jgi:hypothetical protein